MKKSYITPFLMLGLAALSACATPYGNYTTLSQLDNVRMADDSVHELSTLYPPASTHLSLSQKAEDTYGLELVKRLRENGYALDVNSHGLISAIVRMTTSTENKPSGSYHQEAKPSATSEAQSSDKTLLYVVDQVDVGLYRVSVTVDSSVLSRVYRTKSKGIVPAGSWTLKE